MSGIVSDHRIVDGSHDNAELVRTATISQKHKIMTLTFHRNIARQMVAVSITYDDSGKNVEFTFNITAETIEASGNVTATSGNDTVASATSTTPPAPADGEASVPANGETPVPANGETPVPANGETPVPANGDANGQVITPPQIPGVPDSEIPPVVDDSLTPQDTPQDQNAQIPK